MARDLIPPPSPAGRPPPDAPRFIELPPEPPPAQASAARTAAAAGPSPYRHRFGFVMGALAGILLAALLLVVVVLATGGDSEEGLAPNWSVWRPDTTDADRGAQEIAQHVQGEYHLGGGRELVLVTGGPLEIQSVPLGVALRPPDGSIRVLTGTAVMYTLNGLGPHGSIATGKPSLQRHLLLRREALELALYSFRYLHGVDMVVALLPPATTPGATDTSAADPTQSQSQAIFYRPGDLKPQLQVPLRATFGAAPPPSPAAFVGGEARKVDSLTRSNLFLYTIQQAQDAKAYIVLDRPRP